MTRPEDERPSSGWSALFGTDAPPRARMAAFAVAFVLAAVLGLILGAGPSSLAIASIAGGLASIGVEWVWHQRAGRR
jgi:hypothetical protein